MAGGKRRGTGSPARPRSPKRRFTKGPERGATPASATDDYVFRVKVISTTTNLHDGIFKEAVQGLVKICFPEGILDQLGTHMVEQHMKEEDAPAENIVKMTELFRSELVHRMTGMLAATSRLHAEVKDDDSDDIATSQTTVPSSATSRASERDQSSTQRTDQGTQEHEGYDLQEELVDVEETQGVRKRQASRITKKVSCTWRWDFDPDTVNEDDLPNVIKRPGDLFAFHALPIAKDLVGPNAGRKEIRDTIQNMLNDTDNATFSKWIESFHKLHRGDNTMLVRGPCEKALDGRSAMTPAPTGARRQANLDAGGDSVQAEFIQDAVLQNGRIKRENDDNSKVSGIGARREPAETDHDTTTAPTAIRRALNEEAQHGATRQNDVNEDVDKTTAGVAKDTGILDVFMTRSQTPIYDILLGTSYLGGNKKRVVRVIIDKLRNLLPSESIMVGSFSGPQTPKSLAELGMDLSSIRSNTIHERQVRIMMEHKLINWVLPNLASFGELKSHPFVFVNMMPSYMTVSKTLCTPELLTWQRSVLETRDEIFGALGARNITVLCNDDSDMSGSYINRRIIDVLSKDRSSLVKRGELEKLLRLVAYHAKDKFPELKETPLVKEWELKTGQVW